MSTFGKKLYGGDNCALRMSLIALYSKMNQSLTLPAHSIKTLDVHASFLLASHNADIYVYSKPIIAERSLRD